MSSPAAPATGVAVPRTAPQERVEHVPRYRVMLHNDDVTPMDFVVTVLRRFFRLGWWRARRVMWAAHQTGCSLVGVWALEVAEFRVDQAHSHARTCGYPLTFSLEPE